MKNTYSTSKGSLVISCGIGIINYTIREEGRFQIKFGSQIKEFTTLLSAALYFDRLTEEASLWDMNSEPILVESKYIIS